jgi:hypothetical protein
MDRKLIRRIFPGIMILLYLPVFGSAQIPRTEFYGNIGSFRAGTDEGFIGDATRSFGGALAVGIHGGIVAGLDVQTSKVAVVRSPDNFYITRRTIMLPHLLYRWGNPRAYFFLGSGAGAQFESTVWRNDNFLADHRPPDWQEVKPGVFEREDSETSRILFAPKTGFAVFPGKHLGFRLDLYMASWNMGARIGAGFRF